MGLEVMALYPYVPTMNDKEAEKIAHFANKLKNVKSLRILAYHNYAERKYQAPGLSYPLPSVPVPTREELASVVEKMKQICLKASVFH